MNLVLVLLLNEQALNIINSTKIIHEFQLHLNLDSNFVYVGEKIESEYEMKQMSKMIEVQSKVFYQERSTYYRQQHEIKAYTITAFKSELKLGFLYDLTHDYTEANKYFKAAYNTYVDSLKVLADSYSTWEIRSVADLIEGKLVQSYMNLYDVKNLIELFGNHSALFKRTLSSLSKEHFYLEYKWRVQLIERHIVMLNSKEEMELKRETKMWIVSLCIVIFKLNIGGGQTINGTKKQLTTTQSHL